MHQFFPDALSRLCVNNNPSPPTATETENQLVVLRPAIHLDPETYRLIQEVHNGEVGHCGLHISKTRLKDNGHGQIPNRDIEEFIRQCPNCQVMNRLKIPIKTHPFTCASYNPFEVLHLDHIGPLPVDSHGNEYILVIIDAFSRWVELFPTRSTNAFETATIILNHVRRFGSPQEIHTDRGPAFHSELVRELLCLMAIEQSFATAYSKEENGIVNYEVLRHLHFFSISAFTISGHLNNYHWFSVL